MACLSRIFSDVKILPLSVNFFQILLYAYTAMNLNMPNMYLSDLDTDHLYRHLTEVNGKDPTWSPVLSYIVSFHAYL